MIVFTIIPTALVLMPEAVYAGIAGPAPNNIAPPTVGLALGAIRAPAGGGIRIAVDQEANVSGPPEILPAVTLGVADLPARAGAKRRGTRR